MVSIFYFIYFNRYVIELIMVLIWILPSEILSSWSSWLIFVNEIIRVGDFFFGRFYELNLYNSCRISLLFWVCFIHLCLIRDGVFRLSCQMHMPRMSIVPCYPSNIFTIYYDTLFIAGIGDLCLLFFFLNLAKSLSIILILLQKPLLLSLFFH